MNERTEFVSRAEAKGGYSFVFTVFTPTYNRAHTLPRVWESLRRQTFRDFEWIVVDDGSTDNTQEIVSKWIKEADFPIRYLRQAHGHKKAASNLAVREARGELFLTLDSDDECVPTALERLWWHWNNIPADQRQNFSAVTVLCADENGAIVGDRFPCSEWFDSDSLDLIHRLKVKGEKWGFQRTDIMRQFPFPEQIPGFVPEGVVWSRIALEYKTRWVNEALRIYHDSADGLMRGSASLDSKRRAAPGNVLWMTSVFTNEWPYFRYNKRWFIRCAINFTRFNLHCGDAWVRKGDGFKWSAGLLIVAMYPLGCLAYLIDCARG
jgi:glycosyltransferase involved in cell wall biosynthesis